MEFTIQKRIIHHNQVASVPGTCLFNIWKSIHVTHDINKLKKKSHMIISIDAIKVYDKTQHPFMINTLIKIKIEGNFLNLINSTYKKPTANITLNGEKLKAFLLRLGTRQVCPLSSLLFTIILEVLANAIRKGNKRYIDWKGGKKTLFTDAMIIYVEALKEQTKTNKQKTPKPFGTSKLSHQGCRIQG